MDITEFDEIRPYHDEELPQVMEELIKDPAFQRAACLTVPDLPFEVIAEKMRLCKSKLDFQIAFCYGILKKIVDNYTDGLTLSSDIELNKNQAFTYISNHRDIILDAGFLSVLLVEHGLESVEIAIGDNLLIYPWIKKLVRINKSFIVQRALTMRQMLESSKRMSRYMHYTINDKKQSIWIAQREGRAKDSNDRTQDSVLKMLAMGGDGSVQNRLAGMNIVPLALSYEYDPCDYLKAKEFQLKRDKPDFQKTTQDDLKNMEVGMFGYKGRVHFHIGHCLSDEIAQMQIAKGSNKSELFTHVSELIDRNIHQNYRFYPGNYVAYDLLNKTDAMSTHYTPEEKEVFISYLDKQIDKIDIENKDLSFLKEKLLLMYANPLINHLNL
ncbi:MAG: 1-acyl-sn-glycerol-3-phosphate acyltransferase [Bacteroides sp.]